MIYNRFLIIPLSILGYFALSAQNTGRSDIGLHMPRVEQLFSFEKKSDSLFTYPIATSTFSKKNDNSPQVITPSVSVMFSAHNLPFFCKIEHSMAKGQKLPLKFRLGSVDYVDEIEGKRSKPK